MKVVHDAGLGHRDAHPGNILIANEQAILIDFGIAGSIFPSYFTYEHFAHPFFAPYEQLEGSREPTVDIYALSASLYYAVKGKTPTPAISRKRNRDKLMMPKQLVSGISDELNQAIINGMELEANNRPQSMQEWLALLPQERFSNVNSSAQTFIASSGELDSEVGIDYSRLRDLLAAKEWEEADQETGRVMLKVINKEYGEILKEEIENFPSTDLHTIEHLWLKYSNGRFGFSVQKRIYELVGKNYVLLGKRVGWRDQNGWVLSVYLQYDANAPEGHLPIVFGNKVWVEGDGYGWDERRFLFSRLDSCGL